MKVNTRRQIKKLFKTHSIACNFFEVKRNEYKEIYAEELLGEYRGIFYKDKSSINLNVNTNGKTTKETYCNLLLLINEDTEKINKDMTCFTSEKSYEIVNIEKELDIYYVLRLKEVGDSSED